MSPVAALVWSYDQVKDYVQHSLEEKLKNIPTENIISPDPSIAVPTIEALRYTGHKKELREMFSNLLACSMNKATVSSAHPSFVETIKQLNSDEAKIISLLSTDDPFPIIRICSQEQERYDMSNISILVTDFSLLPYQAKCTNPNFGSSYLENISRLGITDISYDNEISDSGIYEPIFNSQEYLTYKDKLESIGQRIFPVKGYFVRNQYGENFYNACVQPDYNSDVR